MVSYYQHLSVAEELRAVFGPLVNPFDQWRRHEVFRFESTKISQLAPVVRRAEQDPDSRELAVMRWGLVPYWFRKDEDEARKFQGRTFNARGETMWEKSSFKHAARKRRCLVPAVGFTEFRGKAGNKEEVRIVGADGAVLAFGGLWERWKGAPDEPWETFTIVTTPPNALLATLHHRMPLVLPRDAWEAWLDPATPEAQVAALVRPAPEGLLALDDAAPADDGPGPSTDGGSTDGGSTDGGSTDGGSTEH